MRYFKYKNTQTVEKNAYKLWYAEMTKKEKKLYRREKARNTVATIVFFAVMFLVGGSIAFALSRIGFFDNVFLLIIELIVFGFLVIFGMIAAIIVGGLVSSPLWSKNNTYPTFRKNMLREACAPLREYYGLCEPFIVTKCFVSSNKDFDNHDVCVFVVGDELRITTDINRGFFHGERDLGCYAFSRDEIKLSKIQRDDRLVLELSVSDTVFHLGYRAKSYIEKCFLSKEKDKTERI
ncbi:MAG: hypothetical protein IJW53_05395 [Clostridia bacterium]|nr:hypothetical protein [Clostridia bacterium]